MKSANGSFDERVKISYIYFFVMTIICILTCLIAYFLILPISISAAGITIICAFVFCIVSSILLVVFYVFRYRHKLVEIDENFSEQDSEVYKNEDGLAWSKSSQKVLNRYELMNERKKVLEMSIESSRYIALQQQINPHFLYNALDAIRSDMLIAGNVRIAETVEALSKYFSYSISNLDHLATISEELGNVWDYFSIQKYRFEERISLVIKNKMGEDKIRETYIPRLTIQPVVENAIVHGLENLKGSGTVEILLDYLGSDVMIRVSDDGHGMTLEQLEEVNRNLNGDHKTALKDGSRKIKGGIAMHNVNSRIKVLFGEKYGIRIYSIKDIGTHVIILLPNVLEDYMDERI